MSDAVVLWQQSGTPRGTRCTMDQVGEDLFELRLWHGRTLVGCDTFSSEDELLRRAQQLRVEETTRGAPRPSRPPGGRRQGPPRPSGRRAKGGRT